MVDSDSAASPIEPLSPEELQAACEALLLVAEEPLPLDVLAQAIPAEPTDVLDALGELSAFYAETHRGFQLRDVGGGWRFATLPEHHEMLSRWALEGQQNRLSQASLETLAVIAYLQPVSRSRVSGVRGVNVDSVVRTLLARGLVAESGTDAQTGAGTLVTTDYFLERLGLRSLEELPEIAPLLPDAATLEAELATLVHEPITEEVAPDIS